jgi:hypothetical protein
MRISAVGGVLSLCAAVLTSAGCTQSSSVICEIGLTNAPERFTLSITVRENRAFECATFGQDGNISQRRSGTLPRPMYEAVVREVHDPNSQSTYAYVPMILPAGSWRPEAGRKATPVQEVIEYVSRSLKLAD